MYHTDNIYPSKQFPVEDEINLVRKGDCYCVAVVAWGDTNSIRKLEA